MFGLWMMWTDGHPSRRETSSPAARRSITSLSNVTPSACEFRRNRQLATVMIHCKYIRHGTRIPKASSATNDRADLEQVHRTRRDSRIEGQPLRSVPSDSAGQAHYAMRRNSSQEMRNLMARTASSLPPAEWFAVEHALYSAGLLCSSRWWSDARALPLFVGPRTTSDVALPARSGRRE